MRHLAAAILLALAGKTIGKKYSLMIKMKIV